MLNPKTEECCGNAACETAEKVGRKVRAVVDSAAHEAESVATEIRKHPVQASLIAAAAGFVLGSLLHRR